MRISDWSSDVCSSDLTVKKARTWLTENEQAYVFHDFKKDGITRALIADWLRDVSSDVLLNRKGTTGRKLSDEQKAADRKSVAKGKRVSYRVDSGGRRIIKK